MIICCPNCNKNFNLDDKLIPEKGRLLQCSKCNHQWHYIKIINKNVINKKVDSSKSDEISKNNIDKKKTKKSTSKDKTLNKNLKSNITKKTTNKKYSIEYFLKKIIVTIITFMAIVLILDTFKNNISNYFPIIVPLLDTFYQSFLDLNLFIKDFYS